MDHSSVSSHRWQKDRYVTPQQQATYWENKAMQYKSERDQLVKTNEKLALRLGNAEAAIAIMMHDTNFKIPTPQKNLEEF